MLSNVLIGGPAGRIVVSATNTVYVFGKETVTLLSESGEIVSQLPHRLYGTHPPPGKATVSGVAIGPAGDLFVAAMDRLAALDSRGSVLWSFGPEEQAEPWFSAPAINNGTGNIYTTYQFEGRQYPPCLCCLSPEGVCQWKSAAEQCFHAYGSGLGPPAVGVDGSVYALGNGRLYSFGSGGERRFTIQVAGTPLGFPVVDVGLDRVYFLSDCQSDGWHVSLNCIDGSGRTVWEPKSLGERSSKCRLGDLALGTAGNVIVLTYGVGNDERPTLWKSGVDGKLLWRTSLRWAPGEGLHRWGVFAHAACPTVDVDGTTFVAVGGRSKAAVLVCDSSGAMTDVWEFPEDLVTSTAEPSQPVIIRSGLMAVLIPAHAHRAVRLSSGYCMPVVESVLYLIE